MTQQRFISNHDNALLNASITAADVAPASNAAFEQDAERSGRGSVLIEGDFTGLSDATLDVEVTGSDATGSDRVSAPEFTGVGNGTLDGLAASGATAQAYTVTLIDLGTDTVPAEFPIEGVTLQAAAAGIAGNLLELQVDAGGISYAPTGETTVEGASAKTDTFESDAWELGGLPLVDGRLDPATPRIALGDDPTIYRPYRERRDGRWLYRLTPALSNDVAKGAAVQQVTGSRTVTLTDGSTSEVYSSVITAWDLLGQIQASSGLAIIDGAASNDRTPGGMASRELSLITDAKITRVEGVGTRYVTDLEGLAATEDAKSQTVTVECTAANSVGRERWAVVGSADGDLGTATTAQAFESDVLDFTIPKKIPLGGEGLKFQHVSTRYVSDDVEQRAPICTDQMYTGAKASSRTMTLTYQKRPGADCACEATEYDGSVDPGLLGIEALADSGTVGDSSFDRSPYDAAYQAALDDLADATPGAAVYTVTHKAITDLGREAVGADNQWGVKAVSADGAWLVAQDDAGGDIEVYEYSGGEYSLTETIGIDIAEAGSAAAIQFQQVAIISGEPRLIAKVTGSSSDGLYRLDRASGVWSATDLGINPSINNLTLLMQSADGLFFQIEGTLYNADGSTHSSLPAQPNSAAYGRMSPDAAYFVVGDVDVAGDDTVTIYSRSGTTYTAELSESPPTFGILGQFSLDGSRFATTSGSDNIKVLDRVGASWSEYQTIAGAGPALALSGDGLTIFEYPYNSGGGSWEVYRDSGAAFASYGSGAFDDYQATERDVFITNDGARIIANDDNRDTTLGTNSGAADVFEDGGSAFAITELLQQGDAGPLIGLFDRAGAGSVFERGWCAEFSDQTDAETWRDAYRAMGSAEADGAKWRARIDLTSAYADDLDPNDEGLTISEPYYIGTQDVSGNWSATLYDTEAEADAAIEALADETVQVTNRTDTYERAEPVVDYKTAYDPFDDYIAALSEIHAFLADVVRVPDLEDEFLAAWNLVIADKSDVISEAIDGRDPAVRDRYADEIAAFETERANFGVAWEDTGAEYWWVFAVDDNAAGYLPAFTNVVYHSATRDNSGFPYSTQEFAFVIKVECVGKLQEGDQIILNLDTGDAAYVVGDRWEIDVVSGASGDFYGGVDGDNTLTWDIRGSSSGALGTYSVEDGNEAAYASNGLSFTIYRGAIPFSAGDQFSFSIEGGAWRWRVNEGDWTDEAGFPDTASTLQDGLTARFVTNKSPSFITGDAWRWLIRQPNAPAHALTSHAESWAFADTNTAALTLAEAAEVGAVALGRNTLADGSEITLTLKSGGATVDTVTVTTSAAGAYVELSAPVTVDAVDIEANASGSIEWLWAGSADGFGADGRVSLVPTYDMARTGRGALWRGTRSSAQVQFPLLLTPDVNWLLEALDYSKRANDAPALFIPNKEAPAPRLVTFEDDALSFADAFAWTDDTPSVENVSLQLRGVV